LFLERTDPLLDVRTRGSILAGLRFKFTNLLSQAFDEGGLVVKGPPRCLAMNCVLRETGSSREQLPGEFANLFGMLGGTRLSLLSLSLELLRLGSKLRELTYIAIAFDEKLVLPASAPPGSAG
jgi:hypothetical protein